MKSATTSIKFKTVDQYQSSLPPSTKDIFKAVRKTVKAAAPSAEEVISYNIPALKLNGGLVYFAAWKEHISLYPRTAGMEKEFKSELSPYESAKGTLKFPLDSHIPLDLISRIVKFRVKENTAAGKTKKTK